MRQRTITEYFFTRQSRKNMYDVSSQLCMATGDIRPSWWVLGKWKKETWWIWSCFLHVGLWYKAYRWLVKLPFIIVSGHQNTYSFTNHWGLSNKTGRCHVLGECYTSEVAQYSKELLWSWHTQIMSVPSFLSLTSLLSSPQRTLIICNF